MKRITRMAIALIFMSGLIVGGVRDHPANGHDGQRSGTGGQKERLRNHGIRGQRDPRWRGGTCLSTVGSPRSIKWATCPEP